MHRQDHRPVTPPEPEQNTVWLWGLILGGILVFLLAVFGPRITLVEMHGNGPNTTAVASTGHESPQATAAFGSRQLRQRT
ncbi:MAG TPA: hypothetical protein VK206_13455, partial [Anaerolineales bacterium]|nr:hypothetical protein [Anaerolineales bacterium]